MVGISGRNGIGKTNLLDAIYYLCFTKSYFQNKERNNILYGQDGFRIEGNWQQKNLKETTTCIYREGKKTVSQDNLPYEKVSEHIGKYHAVMIAPDDLGIINNGSEGRRKFIDGLLAQTDKDYLENLLSYQKVLQQKNAYLKQVRPENIIWDLLDTYDAQLSEYGKALIKKRQEIASFLPEKVAGYYALLCNNKNEIPEILYQVSAGNDDLEELLRQNRQYDVEYKRTVKGPHTEDWLFLLNGHPLKTQASQGQKKSFLISLKLAQLSWMQENKHAPILLMDDIFEKLDKLRIERLFQLLSSFGLPQLFITHTDVKDMEKFLPEYQQNFQIIEMETK